MKIGLFGGTFDPIHLGHLRCAEEVREMFGLKQVVFIPALHQPLKAGQTILPFHHRENMINCAITDNQFFSISDLENRRNGYSYSIDTVNYFKNRGMSGDMYYFILGEDAFKDITQWKQWEMLLTSCSFIIMSRPGYTIEKLIDILPSDFASTFTYEHEQEGYKGIGNNYIYFRQLTQLDISSTDIRQRLAQGLSIRYLVPDTVSNYIHANKLYHV
ncbi:MAG: nicotinate-nucleotide adenylyltransferase [Syntrophales bacterium]|jgi:nicotinate-nucleotide adenylyltransferase|nr:nicotinate-nucleotide adenylyltransferase [Syntrophales bacterium]MDY0045245.1 nicotinate-nucleotide adenylyltransferase [Syntrophales bacterium]